MVDPGSAKFLTYFLRRYPRRSALIIFLLILSGSAEGVGIVTFLPLLEVALGESSAGSSELTESITTGLAFVGLEPTLGVLLLVIVVGMTLKAIFLWLAMKQVGYTVAHVATDLRLLLLRALLQARWGYFVSQPAGSFANAVGTEAYRASTAYREMCAGLAAAIQVLLYTVVALIVSWQIALFAVVAGIAVAVPLNLFVRMSRRAGKHQTTLMKSLIGRLTDALQGIKPIKAMARENHLWPLLEQETLELNKAQQRQVLAAESRKLFQEPLLVIILAIGLFVVLGLGTYPFGEVLIMVFLFHRLVGRVYVLQGKYQTMAVAESAFWSLHESTTEAEKEHERSTGKLRPPPLRDQIALESVEFSYGDHRVLDRVSLTIPAGEFVAIVGPSGAGKTTIADLIIGLYEPQAGEVTVDGTPLAELDMTAWRHTIGYVPQEMFLFHESIMRNVTLGDESITADAVREALRIAGAWDFVRVLPDQLETQIGERGSRLSGGQRQRIAIARALVRNPQLLVLDEVTTSLDPATEAGICETLRQLHGKVAVVSISHQAAMVDAADIVYRLENGRVTEERSSTALEAPATA